MGYSKSSSLSIAVVRVEFEAHLPLFYLPHYVPESPSQFLPGGCLRLLRELPLGPHEQGHPHPLRLASRSHRHTLSEHDPHNRRYPVSPRSSSLHCEAQPRTHREHYVRRLLPYNRFRRNCRYHSGSYRCLRIPGVYCMDSSGPLMLDPLHRSSGRGVGRPVVRPQSV